MRHLNRLNTYGMFAPREAVLDFNAGFMLGIENNTQSWANMEKLNAFYDRHLHSLKIASFSHEFMNSLNSVASRSKHLLQLPE